MACDSFGVITRVKIQSICTTVRDRELRRIMLSIEGRLLLGVCVHEEHDALAEAWETAARGLLEREFVDQVKERILEQKPAKLIRVA